MNFDEEGTEPGLVAPVVEPIKKVNMRCRVQGCNSITAVDVTPKSNPDGHHIYQCEKCKRTWGISVGGGINL